MSYYIRKIGRFSYFIAGFGLFFLFLNLPKTEAASRKIESFLESLKYTPYDFHFLRVGLSSVFSFNAISEDDPDSLAIYRPKFGLMQLPHTSLDSRGNLKPIDELSDDDFSSIAHEAFHAYRLNFIDIKESQSANKAWLKKRSRDLFMNIRRDRREQVLEEAYAIYIESVIQQVRKLKNELIDAAMDERKCRIQMKKAALLWQGLNNEPVSSDYRRDSIFDYVIDGFRLVAGLEISRIVDVEKPIEKIDKFWVQQEILNSRFLKPFAEIFASELQHISCNTIANN